MPRVRQFVRMVWTHLAPDDDTDETFWNTVDSPGFWVKVGAVITATAGVIYTTCTGDATLDVALDTAIEVLEPILRGRRPVQTAGEIATTIVVAPPVELGPPAM